MEEKFMRRALELARKAEGQTSPNPMVGAVIVKENKILGEGYHRRAGGAHAEIHALKAAGENARGATMYVTLEPCNHYGRTPPCTEAIINAGIARVVAAAKDPNPLVAGKGLERLTKAGIEVDSGLLEEKAIRLNEVFIKYITAKKPFVVWKTAMTLDGKIASSTGDSRWVTGPSSREIVHRLRNIYDAIMVGIDTVLADNPALTTRLPETEGKDPVRVVVDSNLRFPENARMLTQESSATTIIATTDLWNETKRQKARKLQQLGVEILEVAASQGRVDLSAVLDLLAQKELTSVLLEGGAQLAASFVEQNLVDKVHVFIAPKLIGGQEAPGPLSGKGLAKMDDALKLKEWRVEHSGEDILITGYL